VSMYGKANSVLTVSWLLAGAMEETRSSAVSRGRRCASRGRILESGMRNSIHSGDRTGSLLEVMTGAIV